MSYKKIFYEILKLQARTSYCVPSKEELSGIAFYKFVMRLGSFCVMEF